jgi:hypothetical protein
MRQTNFLLPMSFNHLVLCLIILLLTVHEQNTIKEANIVYCLDNMEINPKLNLNIALNSSLNTSLFERISKISNDFRNYCGLGAITPSPPPSCVRD